MALEGIGESNNPELSVLQGVSAFAAKRTKQNVQEQLRPSQLEDFRKTDVVSLSATALQLSREALTPESPVKETKQE